LPTHFIFLLNAIGSAVKRLTNGVNFLVRSFQTIRELRQFSLKGINTVFIELFANILLDGVNAGLPINQGTNAGKGDKQQRAFQRLKLRDLRII
jgi:hypothetical protein